MPNKPSRYQGILLNLKAAQLSGCSNSLSTLAHVDVYFLLTALEEAGEILQKISPPSELEEHLRHTECLGE